MRGHPGRERPVTERITGGSGHPGRRITRLPQGPCSRAAPSDVDTNVKTDYQPTIDTGSQ